MLVTPAFAARPSSPPGRVITGGSFWASDSGFSGSVVYTDPDAYYPQSFSWGGASNTYGPQVREFFTDEEDSIITLEGTVYMENIGGMAQHNLLRNRIGLA